MNYALLREHLKRDEGYEIYPYDCLAGKTTIGVGWNLTDNGLPEDIIENLFERSIETAIKDCAGIFKTWHMIPDMKQVVLANMSFQLGRSRLSKFKKMIKAVNEEDWSEAAHQMLDSRWANQTPDRANRLVAIMRN